ncbi:histidinol dehydrogenase-domain-containing protein [Chytridium lagenaria]|nr:histidinol dehydrogenase-domain-containing protein [Chytridium lagenaria]
MFVPYLKDNTTTATAIEHSSLAQTLAILTDLYLAHPLPASLKHLIDSTGCWQDLHTLPTALDTINAAISILDSGLTKLILTIPSPFHSDLLEALPSDRLIARLDFTEKVSLDTLESIKNSLDKLNVDLIVSADSFKTMDAAEAFAACLVTDRTDGLFPTVVVDEQRVSLGLAYSSVKSLMETVRTGQGVYQSRSRGLWYKGLTSGATQAVRKIRFDCDKDTLEFVVDQKEPGYCHLSTRNCFSHDSGLTALSSLLRSRKLSAPSGSYTRRLFDNPNLLNSKIMEEAQELCEAQTNEDIAWETADLLYFALVKCANHGVSLTDIERQLDRRSKKVTRRPGNAKPSTVAPVVEGAPPAINVPGNVVTPVVAPAVNASTNVSDKVAPTNVPTAPSQEEDLSMQMKVYTLSDMSPETYTSLLKRPIIKSDEIFARVRPIIESVAKDGDQAIMTLTEKFDGVKLTSTVLKAPFPSSAMQIDPKVKSAIDTAFDNIRAGDDAGVTCSRFHRAIERVGLYVPGGTAVLPSTALMLGVPAMVAGCREIVVASPPRKDGSAVPEVVYVAEKVGACAIVLAGGAQAVAAMAYGTESGAKGGKICGPGNQYVTAAKMLLQNEASAMISIDMPAGPSELLVIADMTSNPAYVASDLLSQAEHGVDSQVVLVGVNLTMEHLNAIQSQVQSQGRVLPRAGIAAGALRNSFVVLTDLEGGMKFSNEYAPEHLILHVEEAERVLGEVVNAGSVCGDYASGTNHTLPTYGYARMYSGVNTHTFVKHITSQRVTREGMNLLGDTVMTLAEVEGLEAHRNAVAIRLRDIRK